MEQKRRRYQENSKWKIESFVKCLSWKRKGNGRKACTKNRRNQTKEDWKQGESPCEDTEKENQGAEKDVQSPQKRGDQGQEERYHWRLC